MNVKDFGSLISKLRLERRMTQDELAKEMNVSKQTISNYERNKRKPGYEELEALADIFNVPMGFFLSEKEQQEKLNQIYKSYNTLNRGRDNSGERVISLEQTIPTKTEDDELWELREVLRRNPEVRILFSATKGAKKEHIKAAAAMLEALKANDGSME